MLLSQPAVDMEISTSGAQRGVEPFQNSASTWLRPRLLLGFSEKRKAN